jgi:hypothetical protein
MTWKRENSCPYWDSNYNPSIIQPIPSRYTDFTIPVPTYYAYTYAINNGNLFSSNIKLAMLRHRHFSHCQLAFHSVTTNNNGCYLLWKKEGHSSKHWAFISEDVISPATERKQINTSSPFL